MIRTTEEASAIHVLVIGLDGKSKTVYEVRPPMAAFADLANTLDHARNGGLESVQPDGPQGKSKVPVTPPDKNRHVVAAKA